MTSFARAVLLAAVVGLSTSAGAEAAEGWTYDYKGISVTTEGSPSYAVTLAHNLHRLDSAVTALLGIKLSAWRPPMRIYSLSSADATKLLGGDDPVGTSFSTSGYGGDVLLTDVRQENRYWGAYFGYAGNLLLGEGPLRYPIWYVRGFSQLFASAQVQMTEVTIGQVPKWLVAPLLSNPLIPLRTLFNMREDDPSLRNPQSQQRYDAESWFLVHLIAIERQRAEEFQKYLSLMSAGHTESDAFAASFTISYEELDKELYTALANRKLYQLVLKVPDEPDNTKPERISAAELDARLAEFAGRRKLTNDYALQLANQAVQIEPGNLRAHEALAALQALRGNYPEALSSLGSDVPGTASPTPLDFANRADVLTSIVYQVGQKEVTPGVDRTVLRQQARDDYEKAVAQDGENLAYMAGLAVTIAAQKDSARAKTLLPQAEQLYYQHPRYAILPRALAFMCGNTGDLDNALKFATAWRSNALTSRGRDEANSYISQMRSTLQRQETTHTADTP